MGDTSRYRPYHTKRLTGKRRVIRVWGVDEDTGKYQRCWNCGFIVDMTRYQGADQSQIIDGVAKIGCPFCGCANL